MEEWRSGGVEEWLGAPGAAFASPPASATGIQLSNVCDHSTVRLL